MNQGLPAILYCIYINSRKVDYVIGLGKQVNNLVALVGDFILLLQIGHELLRLVKRYRNKDQEQQKQAPRPGMVVPGKDQLTKQEEYFLAITGLVALLSLDICVQKVFMYQFCFQLAFSIVSFF